MFENRHEAGRQLAERVAEAIGPEDAPVVVGLARGGVVVAAPVAERLGAPLDVLVVRKIGVPWQPELGVGALAEGGHRVLNERLVADIGLDAASIEEVAAREYRELERRVASYRRGREPIALTGRTVIVVDDGLATGYTARAAVLAVRARGATSVILAVPVAAPDSVAELSEVADRVVTVSQPAFLMAIGGAYRDFSQVSDEEVVRLLARGRHDDQSTGVEV